MKGKYKGVLTKTYHVSSGWDEYEKESTEIFYADTLEGVKGLLSDYRDEYNYYWDAEESFYLLEEKMVLTTIEVPLDSLGRTEQQIIDDKKQRDLQKLAELKLKYEMEDTCKN